MFEQWTSVILSFFLFIALGVIIYATGRRATRPENEKYKTYTCGEPFDKVSISPDNFYRAAKKSIGIKDLRELHSGKLSDYLLWFVVGVAVILILVVWT